MEYLEDSGGNSDSVLAGGGPVELLHTPITDEWRIQCGEIVTGTDDWHSGDLLFLQARGYCQGVCSSKYDAK